MELKKIKFDLPKHEYEALARCLLPIMQEFYETDEGKAFREQCRKEREEKAKQTADTKPE